MQLMRKLHLHSSERLHQSDPSQALINHFSPAISIQVSITESGRLNLGRWSNAVSITPLPACSLSDVTPHVLRHSFASIANDLAFTEVTIAALVGHAKGSVTSKYIHTLDTALIMAADTISGYIQGLLDDIEFRQTAYALDRDSRKAALRAF
jgi:integrase